MKNVMVVVDTRNIMWCLNKCYGRGRLNYGDYMRKAVPQEDVLYRGIAYIAQEEEQSYKFASFLQHLGLESRFKPPVKKYQRDPDAEAVYQPIELDVMLAIDVMKIASTNKLDRLVIGSTSRTLEDLIVTVKRDFGIHTTVFACGVPIALKRAADSVIEIPESMLYSVAKE